MKTYNEELAKKLSEKIDNDVRRAMLNMAKPQPSKAVTIESMISDKYFNSVPLDIVQKLLRESHPELFI